MKVNKIVFMLRKLKDDIFSRKDVYKISDDLHSNKLGEYYFLFEEEPSKLNKLIAGFDENGIPVNSSYIDVKEKKLHYYPISIGQYALAVFNTYVKSGSTEKEMQFIKIADWFYSNMFNDERLGNFWVTDIAKPEYKIYSTWKSAFVQSRAISVLLRAWQLTGNNKYFAAATGALKIFNVDIKEGGVTVFTKHGKFFEEYAAPEPTMVLDGHMFSLLGLYDYYRAAGGAANMEYKHTAKQLFDEGLESLIKWIPQYDMGYWLRFNFCMMKHYPKIDPCTIGYLKLIALQLKLLHKLTGRIELKNYYGKISGYNKPLNVLRMLPLKYIALRKLNRI